MTPSTLEERYNKKFVTGHGPSSLPNGTIQEADYWVEADPEELLEFIQQEIFKAKQEERERILDGIPCEEKTFREWISKEMGYNQHVQETKDFINSARTPEDKRTN